MSVQFIKGWVGSVERYKRTKYIPRSESDTSWGKVLIGLSGSGELLINFSLMKLSTSEPPFKLN